MNIQSLPLHERPREKLLQKGVDSVKDHELLAILLRTRIEGKNVLEVSQSIIQKYQLEKLLQLSLQELMSIKGIGKDKACTILAAFELTKRAIKVNDFSLPIIKNPQDIVNQLSSIRSHKKEHFMVLYLNARCQIIHRETISIGTVNSSIVHPREVYEPAIRCCATDIILAHNHPSGDPEPSDPDIALTHRLVDVGKIMGIEVMDHIILTQKDFFSMRAEGCFKE